MSASVIVADDKGDATSVPPPVAQDDEHVVVRNSFLVTFERWSTRPRAAGREVNIAIVNALDPVVLLAAASTFAEFLDDDDSRGRPSRTALRRSDALHDGSNGVVVPADAEYVMWGCP